jgi:hypothetical protein
MEPILCTFYAQGICRNGNACTFAHEENRNTQNDLERANPALPDMQTLNLNPLATSWNNGGAKAPQICRFFLQGSCYHGDKCRNVHAPTIKHVSQIQPSTISQDVPLKQQTSNSHPASSDSRAKIPCRFFSHPGGCHKSVCPYLHVIQDGPQSSQNVEEDEDKASH